MSNWNDMIQWEFVLPPSRPTNYELFRIEEVLKDYDNNSPVCVLGSTPEFRELLNRYNFSKVYIFEKNIEFNLLMNSLLPVRLDEKIVKGDWLDTLGDYSEYFQIILSDLTMGNISYKNRKKFYSIIKNALTKNGVFIDKVLTIDFELLKINKIVEKYEKLPINLRSINNFSCEYLFCSELISKNKNIVDSSLFYKIIENGSYSNKIKFFAKKSEIVTPKGFKWYYGLPWRLLTKEYFNRYKKIVVYEDDNYLSPYYKKVKQFFNYI